MKQESDPVAETLETPDRFSLNRLPQWMRSRFTTPQRFLLLCMVAGVLCGLTAVSFHLCIHFVFHTLFEFARPLAGSLEGEEMGSRGWLRFFVIMTFAPALGGLIVGLMIRYVAPSAVGSGIPQTKLAYYRKFGVIRLSEGVWRFILGTVFIGLGNSLGREGPTVHICSAIASKLGQLFGLAKLRVQAMVPVGMAAGIAAAFNAPLSAITFVFEELLDDFSTKALGGIVLAVVIAATLERSILGEHPVFPTVLPHFSSDWWMLVCIPLGITSALVAHYFVGALLTLRLKVKDWKQVPVWLKPAIGGLIVGLLGSCVFWITGQNGVFSIGYENLRLTTAAEGVLWVFALLLITKLAATLISYTFGGSGGLFSPILVCGGMLGAVFGSLYTSFADLPIVVHAGEIVGACALLGMGAFFAAAIRCPFTSILIIFEMTLNYSLILPLMTGNMIAYFIASRLRPVPIYNALLVQDGINLRAFPNYQGKQDYGQLPVSTIMSYDVFSAQQDWQCAAAIQELKTHKHHAYPVLDAHGKLVGCITHHEMEESVRQKETCTIADLIEAKTKPLVTLNPECNIRDAARILIKQDVMQAPVVSKTDPTRLIGILTLHDIARAQNSVNDTINRE